MGYYSLFTRIKRSGEINYIETISVFYQYFYIPCKEHSKKDQITDSNMATKLSKTNNQEERLYCVHKLYITGKSTSILSMNGVHSVALDHLISVNPGESATTSGYRTAYSGGLPLTATSSPTMVDQNDDRLQECPTRFLP